MYKKQIVTFIGGFFFIIFILILIVSDQRRTSNGYFRNLNLVLTGIVTDKQIVSNGEGMLYVDIRNTSIPEYDVRGHVSDYYCVIHKGKAEMIENSLYQVHIGDSLAINSQINSFECIRNNKIVFKKGLSIGGFEPFKTLIKNHHRL